MQLLLTGQRFSAQQALQWGLVSDLVPDQQVEQVAVELAKTLAGGAQQAQQFIKEAVLDSMNSPLDRGLQMERKSFQLLFATDDKHEGIQARLDKRPARFAR
jgi:enoyl-CoA hydratase